MSQRSEIKILIITLIITLCVFGIGLGILSYLLFQKNLPLGETPPSPTSSPDSTGTPSNPTPSSSPNADALKSRLSFGEKLLIVTESTPNKELAVAAFDAKNYAKTIQVLEEYLKTKPNDPEALIYLNNARIGNNKSYSIAVSVPIGSDVNTAQELLRGVAQAQEEINATGGINNVPLKILIANDDDDPEIAKQLAQAFVDTSEILGVIGHFGSSTSIEAAKEVYQPQRLVMISPTSTSVELSGIGNYIFRTVPSDLFAGKALAEYMLTSMKKQKAAVFYNSKSSYSKSLKDVFTTNLYGAGGEVVEEFDLIAPDFNAFDAVKTASSQGASVLMLAMNTPTLDKALWVIQANQGKLSLLGGDSAYKPQILQLGSENAVGMVIAVPWHILGQGNQDFATKTFKLWKANVNWRTAMAYDAAKALIAAITVNPTRSGVQKTLSTPGFITDGAGRQIRFLSSGDRNQPVQLVRVEPGATSSYGYDFIPIP